MKITQPNDAKPNFVQLLRDWADRLERDESHIFMFGGDPQAREKNGMMLGFRNAGTELILTWHYRQAKEATPEPVPQGQEG